MHMTTVLFWGLATSFVEAWAPLPTIHARRNTRFYAGIGTQLAEGINLVSVATLYGGGIASALSPCAMSTIPLTVAFLSTESSVGEDTEPKGRTLFFLSLTYAVGLAFGMASLGFAAVLLGQVWGSLFSTSRILPLIASSVATASGLNLLGLLEIEALTNIGKPLSTSDNRQQNEEPGIKPGSNDLILGVSRAFVFGLSSALVSSPCSTPVLASLLGYVASVKDPSLSLPLLFVFAAGFSTPVVAAGAAGVGVTLKASQDSGSGVSDVASSLVGAGLVSYGVFTFLDAAFPLG
mmetsp:Transcript_25835/g.52967  ORF Transcript_25835/g.52967 Transcript_25835/m.52967 type:complete len:293 (+) Transcript_25835:213-1091(+)